MGKCRWCGGHGWHSVESGSSLGYTCEDCGGSGSVPECSECGREYSDGYCSNCFDICDYCEDVVLKEDIKDGLCVSCREDPEICEELGIM